ncbi:hypothetical protein BN1221_00899 [Brenneria goodwinii]|uniref:Uncharacterized protein n=1 Tax=Brenneria goodwinii TaxID=1109412 RepID=A0A0G4JRD4_9GAMM|nr:hypothetical protein BN1221_00899 [Brenneria goodwinii]
MLRYFELQMREGEVLVNQGDQRAWNLKDGGYANGAQCHAQTL